MNNRTYWVARSKKDGSLLPHHTSYQMPALYQSQAIALRSVRQRMYTEARRAEWDIVEVTLAPTADAEYPGCDYSQCEMCQDDPCCHRKTGVA